MSRGTPQIEGSTATQDTLRDWEAVRASSDIQFAPLPPAKPPETPGWLNDLQEWLRGVLDPAAEWLAGIFGQLGEWLRKLLGPLVDLLGIPWAVVETGLIGLAILGVLMLAWRILWPMVSARRRVDLAVEPEWAPAHAAAVALLEDADRLAGQGHFGEAVHLLLQRSVSHIAEAQPDWLQPASTAREIASLPALPPGARQAFAVIAARVERSRFALRDLNAEDWQVARAAYADFALARLAA